MWEHAQALQWKDRTSKHKLTENMKVPSSGQERIEAEQENISIIYLYIRHKSSAGIRANKYGHKSQIHNQYLK
jgi:hypothetical protein